MPLTGQLPPPWSEGSTSSTVHRSHHFPALHTNCLFQSIIKGEALENKMGGHLQFSNTTRHPWFLAEDSLSVCLSWQYPEPSQKNHFILLKTRNPHVSCSRLRCCVALTNIDCTSAPAPVLQGSHPPHCSSGHTHSPVLCASL